MTFDVARNKKKRTREKQFLCRKKLEAPCAVEAIFEECLLVCSVFMSKLDISCFNYFPIAILVLNILYIFDDMIVKATLYPLLTCRNIFGPVLLIVSRQKNQPEPVLLSFATETILFFFPRTLRGGIRRRLSLPGAITRFTGWSISFICMWVCGPTFDHMSVNMRGFLAR